MNFEPGLNVLNIVNIHLQCLSVKVSSDTNLRETCIESILMVREMVRAVQSGKILNVETLKWKFLYSHFAHEC